MNILILYLTILSSIVVIGNTITAIYQIYSETEFTLYYITIPCIAWLITYILL